MTKTHTVLFISTHIRLIAILVELWALWQPLRTISHMFDSRKKTSFACDSEWVLEEQ